MKRNLPSVWPGVPLSQIPTTSAPKRTSKRALNAVRNVKDDELKQFLESDKINYAILKKDFNCSVVSYMANDCVVVQSTQFNQGVPLFVIKIFEDLHFEAFHTGIQCCIFTLSANHIKTINFWSTLDEILRFLSSATIDNKKEVFLQHISAKGPKVVGEKIYAPQMLVRAFVYFATSRALYH